MAQIHRISLFSKRFGFVFKDVYLNCTYRRQAFHMKYIQTSAVGSLNFNSFTHSKIECVDQKMKQFCTAAQSDALESSEPKSDQDVRNLREINLLDSDAMQTFKKIIRVRGANVNKRPSSLRSEWENFLTSDQFKNYCNALEKQLPMLSAQDLKVLLQCVHFKVSSSSILMQKIYHLIIEKINNYDIYEIATIYEALNSPLHKDNQKVQVLQLVCREYFKSNMLDDVHKNKNYNKMAYFCKSEALPLSIKKLFMSILAKHFPVVHNQLPLISITQMFEGFTVPRLRSYFIPDMYEVLKSRIEEKMTLKQIRRILKGLNHLKLEGFECDECLLDGLTKQILEGNPNLLNTVAFIGHLLSLKYLPLPLIKHLEMKFIEPTFTLKFIDFGLRIGRIFTTAYYHPWGYTGEDSTHIECVKKFESLEFEVWNISHYLRYCLFLTILGSSRKLECLNRLFSCLTDDNDNAQSKVLSQSSSMEIIIILHAFARIHFPKDVIGLPKEFLEKCFNSLKTSNVRSMHQILWQTFDTEALTEYCTTSWNHFIDFAVLVNEDNKPQKITVSSDKQPADGVLNIENIQRPPSSKLILYLIGTLYDTAELINSPDLHGSARLHAQSLDYLNCKVVFFDRSKLREIPKAKLIDYLKKKVNDSLSL